MTRTLLRKTEMPRPTMRPRAQDLPHTGAEIHRIDRRRALALALITTAALAAAGCGSTGSKPAARDTQAAPAHPTATEAATTTRAAAAQRFMSQRYSFRVTLTRAWSEHEARSAWNGKKLEGIDSPHFANFEDPTGRTLVAGAAPVAKGTGLAEWRAAMVRAAPPFCSESPSVKQTTLGGEPALAWTAACSDGYHVNKIAALHARRGYIILLPSPTANGTTNDRRIFESIRRSFRFTRH
jgi:hypothetical protein